MNDNGFTHRNRESDPPTIEGEFWFDGAAFIGRDTFKWQDRFEIERDGGSLRASYDPENGASCEVVNMVGFWWGPIVPPWDKSE